MHPKENLHSAIGELAYAIARADGTIQKEEREKFHQLVTSGIKSGDCDLDVAEIMFKVMEKDKFINTATAYDWAMKEIRLNSHYLSPQLKETYIRVIESVAKAFPPVTDAEAHLITRFKNDISPLKGDPIYYEK